MTLTGKEVSEIVGPELAGELIASIGLPDKKDELIDAIDKILKQYRRMKKNLAVYCPTCNKMHFLQELDIQENENQNNYHCKYSERIIFIDYNKNSLTEFQE